MGNKNFPTRTKTYHGDIRVGASSLVWFDNHHGILLLDHLIARHRVISIIPLPVSTVGLPMPIEPDDKYIASEYFSNVGVLAISSISGSGWKATMWNMNVSGKNWCEGYTVDVDKISVDQSFSAILPELWDDETQQLQLKKLMFHGPILSTLNDDLLYMMAKVKHEDDRAWAIAIDMKHAALRALTTFSVHPNQLLLTTACFSCVFPKYLNIPPGADMDDAMEMHFKSLSGLLGSMKTRGQFNELLILDHSIISLILLCCTHFHLYSRLFVRSTCTIQSYINFQPFLTSFGKNQKFYENSNHEKSQQTMREAKKMNHVLEQWNFSRSKALGGLIFTDASHEFSFSKFRRQPHDKNCLVKTKLLV
ncbi:hypothetical protein ZWY2020_055246 [Hordeum vulgare]|nr:hypothetical protein ZWY2020_055246 [Hordeum vulgare]